MLPRLFECNFVGGYEQFRESLCLFLNMVNQKGTKVVFSIGMFVLRSHWSQASFIPSAPPFCISWSLPL